MWEQAPQSLAPNPLPLGDISLVTVPPLVTDPLQCSEPSMGSNTFLSSSGPDVKL